MALVKRNTNSSKIIIIAVVVLAVVGVGYLLFQKLYLEGIQTNAEPIGTAGRKVISNFGESLLRDDRYTSLRSYSVTVEANANTNPGQPNPFQ